MSESHVADRSLCVIHHGIGIGYIELSVPGSIYRHYGLIAAHPAVDCVREIVCHQGIDRRISRDDCVREQGLLYGHHVHETQLAGAGPCRVYVFHDVFFDHGVEDLTVLVFRCDRDSRLFYDRLFGLCFGRRFCLFLFCGFGVSLFRGFCCLGRIFARLRRRRCCFRAGSFRFFGFVRYTGHRCREVRLIGSFRRLAFCLFVVCRLCFSPAVFGRDDLDGRFSGCFDFFHGCDSGCVINAGRIHGRHVRHGHTHAEEQSQCAFLQVDHSSFSFFDIL